ncbi:MAG: site-2 protease family protein [Gaiellales bacterium]
MESSIRLFRIRGIPIGINWSWFAILALIVWTLATEVFPAENEGFGDGTYVGMGVVAAVLFFSSLLAHELGHALQAQREGMRIDGITLWLFGGVARFKGMFPGAGAEFRIAIAGPLVTLVIGVACLLLGLTSAPGYVDGVISWLGYINLVLLAFNLLPALPLDGGRVLRSALWKARDDFGWATHAAVRVSRAIAIAMIAGGVLVLIFVNPVSGIWLAFIGWFLFSAGAAEEQAIAARRAFGDLTVSDLMARDPVSVDPAMTLGRFLDEVVRERRFTTYPVVEADRAVGLLPFNRVAHVPREDWDRRSVADCMLSLADVPVLAPGQPAGEALETILDSRLRRALVLDGERLVGLLSVTDLARLLDARAGRNARR